MKCELVCACRGLLCLPVSLSSVAIQDFGLQLKTDLSQCIPLCPFCSLIFNALSPQSTLADVFLYKVQINCIE